MKRCTTLATLYCRTFVIQGRRRFAGLPATRWEFGDIRADVVERDRGQSLKAVHDFTRIAEPVESAAPLD